ncbi:IS481 family transposase [Saccharopolyspora hordei]|uniref:IS481 family transposase n=1 Tax=Saccharopolyspora hordei TaxID=1838 RepID=UPI0015C9DD94|nr:IS481 family transposase [Saccharopolyspora hordei]
MDPDLVAAVAAVAGGEKLNISRFCAEHGVSRTVFYKYLARFRKEGAAGFLRRSSAPRRRPTTTPPRVREAIVRARKQLAEEGRDNGAISIGWRLEELGVVPVPSRATIHRILVAEGHVVPQPRKRPRCRRRFEYAEPNGLWQIDGMEFYLAGGEKVCILQILDDHSRLDVGTYAATSENGEETWAALQQAFAGYGVPVKILTDNGLAFSSRHRGGMAELERRLAATGVQAIASTPYHPQTCGKDERSHQTLRRWLAKQPPPATLEQLQQLLEQYRAMYNNRRHQGIGGHTPQQRYHATPKATPTKAARPPAGTTQRPVTSTGVVAFSNCSIVIGRRWAGHTATLHWQGDRVSIMINDTVVRTLTLNRSVRYQRLTPQLSTTS